MKKWKCTVCGQVFEGDTPPVPCPVCGAGEAAFEEVEEIGPSRWKCTVCGQVFDGKAPPVPCPVCGAGQAAFERISAEKNEFKQNTNDEFVLIGGGIAALEAARAIRLRNETALITILVGEDHLPYNRPALSDVLSDGISFANIVLEEEAFYQEKNICLKLGTMATAINLGEKTVTLSSGEEIPYTKLLLATGSMPFNPIKTAPNAIPVYTLRTFEDATKLVQEAAGKSVVLVGGGILGLEAAIGLRERGCAVTIVEFAPRIMTLQADEEASSRLKERLEKLGIVVVTGKSVESATATGVVLNDGSSMAADLVLASMGVRSEISLAIALGLELSRGIVVNEFMHTSHKDVWAAGDCAEFGGLVQALVGAASSMGAVAGASMAGDESTAYSAFTPATAFECSGFSLLSVGDVCSKAEETAEYSNIKNGEYRRIFLRGRKLSGVLYLGKNAAAKAIRAVESAAPLDKALELLS